MDGRTHTTKINSVPGGVARNIAEALHKFGYSPFFISAIGNDLFGAQLIKDFEVLKMVRFKLVFFVWISLLLWICLRIQEEINVIANIESINVSTWIQDEMSNVLCG